MTKPLFAANWKMHLGPVAAAAFLDRFFASYTARDDREVWFFAPAVSVARAGRGRSILSCPYCCSRSSSCL